MSDSVELGPGARCGIDLVERLGLLPLNGVVYVLGENGVFADGVEYLRIGAVLSVESVDLLKGKHGGGAVGNEDILGGVDDDARSGLGSGVGQDLVLNVVHRENGGGVHGNGKSVLSHGVVGLVAGILSLDQYPLHLPGVGGQIVGGHNGVILAVVLLDLDLLDRHGVVRLDLCPCCAAVNAVEELDLACDGLRGIGSRRLDLGVERDIVALVYGVGIGGGVGLVGAERHGDALYLRADNEAGVLSVKALVVKRLFEEVRGRGDLGAVLVLRGGGSYSSGCGARGAGDLCPIDAVRALLPLNGVIGVDGQLLAVLCIDGLAAVEGEGVLLIGSKRSLVGIDADGELAVLRGVVADLDGPDLEISLRGGVHVGAESVLRPERGVAQILYENHKPALGKLGGGNACLNSVGGRGGLELLLLAYHGLGAAVLLIEELYEAGRGNGIALNGYG